MISLLIHILKYFSANARVLIISGTHGDAGLSGLNDERSLDHVFYQEDCRRVGVEAGPSRVRGLPVWTWEGLPTINKPAERIEPPPPGSFYEDEDLKGMDVRLANMSYYFGNSQKLREDMNEVELRKSFETKYLLLKYVRSSNPTSSCWPSATPSTATSPCCSEDAGSSPP